MLCFSFGSWYLVFLFGVMGTQGKCLVSWFCCSELWERRVKVLFLVFFSLGIPGTASSFCYITAVGFVCLGCFALHRYLVCTAE
jgi:hypothetical protein